MEPVSRAPEFFRSTQSTTRNGSRASRAADTGMRIPASTACCCVRPRSRIGVTFRSSLMFVEPGHGLASFVQRVGRVSRGAENGHVIVSLSENRRNRYAWTRTIAEVIKNYEELDGPDFHG